MSVALDPVPGGLRVSTPYHAAFLADFKARVPQRARSWQKPYWVIDPQYGSNVVQLIHTHFGVQLSVPQVSAAVAETRTFELRYLGRCKERDIGGPATAFGTTDGIAWTLVFPEPVLRSWFGAGEQQPNEAPTFYVILGIAQTAAAPDIKQAYRRMARQWHPDVCREPDATQRFQAIQRAYAILSDPLQRRKYDAGLLLEQSTKSEPMMHSNPDEYRAPLRCGHILVEGQPQIGRFRIDRIIAWEDIVRSDGKTMVSSWDMENNTVRVEWV